MNHFSTSLSLIRTRCRHPIRRLEIDSMRPSARTLSLSNPVRSYLIVAAPLSRTPPLAASLSTKTIFTPSIQSSTSPEHFNRRVQTYAPPPVMEADAAQSAELEPPPAVDEFAHVDGTRGNSASEDSDHSVVNGASRADEVETEQKRTLPEELSRSVMVLQCESSGSTGNCDVYIVGTAHVSQKSCQEVQAVISCLQPEVVFLELCDSRVAALSPQNLKVPTMGKMVDMWKRNINLFGILYSWFVVKVASKLAISAGSEFRVAFEEAAKYGGKVILGDRPVNITLKRTWAKMPLLHKTKLLCSLLFQAVFLPSADNLNKMVKELDDLDMRTLMTQKMSEEFPTLMETLVHERDKYMSSKLLKVASEHNLVVAVVGKGHLHGIKKHWQQPIEVSELLDIPVQKAKVTVRKIVLTVGVTVAGVAIISGIYL